MFVLISYLKLNMLNLLILFLLVLLGIAFLTLLERKILGYIQFRKGPNKVLMMGLFQPFSDGLKLLSKELFYIYKSNYYLFYLCPFMMFILMLMFWVLFGVFTNLYYLNYSLLLMILMLTISSYFLVFMGWSSNSMYSMIGAMRSVSQMLSFEVSFILIIIILMLMSESYSFMDFYKYQVYFSYCFMFYPLFLLYFVSILVEMNRSPMDFVEGESELVSGFNVEYFSGGFTLIFLAEYGMIIFFSYLSMMMFTNLFFSFFFAFVWINFFLFLIVFMRGLLPRMRYDELMYLCWKLILPMVLIFLIMIMSFKFFLLLLVKL